MNRATPVRGPVSLTVHPHARAVAAARRFVVSVVEDLLDDPTLEDLEVLVSEVVTNGVIHAGTTLELVVTAGNGVVRVESIDQAPADPVVRERPDSEGGYGLRIVAGLARDWGVLHRSGGKSVWFELGYP